MTVNVGTYRAARRLHPTTLVQRIIVSLPGLILFTLPFWSGADRIPFFVLLLIALYAFAGIPLIVAHYLRFRYWITENELVIQSGVFTRQHRNIPIERIQNVEISQPLIPRLFGTARVTVATAGSKTAEGVLEYVALGEARDLRAVVRAYQRQPRRVPREEAADVTSPEPPAEATDERTLIELPFSRVVLSGVYRFSLLYILVIFSAIQYLNLDPEEILRWFTGGRFEAVTRVVAESPWLAALVAVVIAVGFSWLAGIMVNVNRYYGFRLTREGDKLHRRHGLLTVQEGTIPMKKIQALILRANPLMRRHGWAAFKLQTMGVDADRGGHQVAVPFARRTEILDLAPEITPFSLPDTFTSVSAITIRRMTIRYTMALLAVAGIGAQVWGAVLWLLAAWPLISLWAYLQYRNHGYVFDGRFLFVRRGVIDHHVWVLPVEKFQVLYSSASFFQRRLGLATLQVDMAGAPTINAPEIVDVDDERGAELVQQLHAAAQQQAGIAVPVRLPFEDRPQASESRAATALPL